MLSSRLKLFNLVFPGFDNFAEEVGIGRDSLLQKEMSMDVEYDEKDLIKVGPTERKCIMLVLVLLSSGG